MGPIIASKPRSFILGVQYRGGFHISDKCGEIWDRFAERFDEVKPLAKQPIFPYGIHTDIDMADHVCYHTVGIEVANTDTIPSEMVLLEIPEQQYAVFESRFASCMQTLMTFNDWSRQSGYQRSGGPELLQFHVLYNAGFNPLRTNAAVSVYIPISQRDI